MSRTEHLVRLLSGMSPIEVFDYYDGPRFYSCRDVVGQLYIVYWIDETDQGVEWLYVRTSPERYASLRQGAVSIAFALSNPEEGSGFVVRGQQGAFSVEEVPQERIDLEWLPPAEERLAMPVRSLPEKTAEAVDAAVGSHRHVFDLAFDKASNVYEIGAGKLGRLLDAVQNTIYALACEADRDVRRVPEEVKFNSEVLVTSLFASSFGVRLQTKGADLFSSDESARALQTLTELIDAVSEPESISRELHKLNILGRSRFKHLLRVMVDAEVSVKADWGSPAGATSKAFASYSQITLALQKLEATDAATTRTVEWTGRLVGVDVQSDFFALVVDDNEVIKGKLSTAIANRQFAVPSRIVATVEETCIVDPLTDREKWSYVLLAARQPET